MSDLELLDVLGIDLAYAVEPVLDDFGTVVPICSSPASSRDYANELVDGVVQW